jgi:hypothetical protein
MNKTRPLQWYHSQADIIWLALKKDLRFPNVSSTSANVRPDLSSISFKFWHYRPSRIARTWQQWQQIQDSPNYQTVIVYISFSRGIFIAFPPTHCYTPPPPPHLPSS